MDFIGGSLVNFFAAIGAVSTAFLLLNKAWGSYVFSRVVIPKNIIPQLVVCSCIVAVFVVLLESPVNFAAWFIGIAASFIGIPVLILIGEDY